MSELWGLDDLDAEEALARLHDASLIEFDLGTESVRIHDVMRACFASQLGDKALSTHARCHAMDRGRCRHRTTAR